MWYKYTTLLKIDLLVCPAVTVDKSSWFSHWGTQAGPAGARQLVSCSGSGQAVYHSCTPVPAQILMAHKPLISMPELKALPTGPWPYEAISQLKGEWPENSHPCQTASCPSQEQCWQHSLLWPLPTPTPKTLAHQHGYRSSWGPL